MLGLDAVQWTALGVGAVLVFWMLGAYNRLVRLRNRIGAAWDRVDDQLARRRTALPLLLQALREPLAAEAAALDAAQLALQGLNEATAAARTAPLTPAQAQALTAADAQVDAALARLGALLEQHAGLQERDDVGPLRRELADAAARLAFERQVHDDAVAIYNTAVSQHPTRLLKGLFGFMRAGYLLRRNEP